MDMSLYNGYYIICNIKKIYILLKWDYTVTEGWQLYKHAVTHLVSDSKPI